MVSLVFTFASGAREEERRALLEELRKLDGVTASSKLMAESDDPDISRIAFADVREDGVEALLARLRRDRRIESAGRPPERGVV